jgi:hypothetical protein
MQPDYAIPVQRNRSKSAQVRPWVESKLFPMWGVLVGGYLAVGRPFAFLGVAPLFIGEIYLMVMVLWNRNNWLGKFINGFFHFELICSAVFLHLAWGIFEIFRSLYLRHPVIEVFRTAAFNYYPLYCVIGLMIGKEISIQTYYKVWKYIVIVASIHILLDPVFKLSEGLGYNMPMPPVITLAIIALWDYFKTWKTRYILLAVSIFPDFFQSEHGHRSWVLGLLAGLVALAASKPKLLLKWAMISFGGLMFFMIVGPLIPGPNGTTPPLDPVVQIAHILASSNPDLAVKLMKARGYKSEVDDIRGEEGTAQWRKSIWAGIFRELNTLDLQLMGEGEGESLQKVTPNGEDIHTPHNISMYCIFYTGWIGLGIFTFLIYALFHTAWRLRNPALRMQLVATILAVVVITMTGNLLEAPFGAIPFYLICGVAIGIARREASMVRKPRRKSFRLMDMPAEVNPRARRPDWSRSPRPQMG